MKSAKASPVWQWLVPLVLIGIFVAWYLFDTNSSREQQILLAAQQGDTATIHQLLQEGVDVNTRQRAPRYVNLMKGRPYVMNDYTPLMYAAMYGQKDAAKVLLENGATVNAHSITGNTPLMAAANMGNVEIVTLLIRNGADVRAKNRYGATAVNFATKRNAKPKFEAIIKQLKVAETTRSK